jgi:hypothetical protein
VAHADCTTARDDARKSSKRQVSPVHVVPIECRPINLLRTRTGKGGREMYEVRAGWTAIIICVDCNTCRRFVSSSFVGFWVAAPLTTAPKHPHQTLVDTSARQCCPRRPIHRGNGRSRPLSVLEKSCNLSAKKPRRTFLVSARRSRCDCRMMESYRPQ